MVSSTALVVSDFKLLACLGAVIFIHVAATDTETTVAPPGRPAVNATSDCPSDVSMKILSCFSRSEILDGVLRLMADPQHVPLFCREDQNGQLKDCLQENFALCSRDPTRLGLLRLQSDPLLSHTHLLYFCQHLEAVKIEVNCTSYRMTSTCVTEMSSKFRNSLKSTSHIKDKLDAACTYNDDFRDCLLRASGTWTTTTSTAGTTISINSSTTISNSSSPRDGCQASVRLYEHLARAQRFPYCDLDPLSQHRRLHDVLTATQGDSSSPDSSSMDRATQGDSTSPGGSTKGEKTQDVESVHLQSLTSAGAQGEGDTENVSHQHRSGSGDVLGLKRSCSSATSWSLLVVLAVLYSFTLTLAS